MLGVLRASLLAAATTILLASACSDESEPVESVQLPANASRPNGMGCTTAGECVSGFCVEGVCCDTACTGKCKACKAMTKADGSADGTCGNAKVGPPPLGKSCIPLQFGQPCASSECNGAGVCAEPVGAACKPSSCPLPTVQSKASCVASGACHETFIDCDPFVCSGTACLTSCSSDADCASGNFCRAAQCLKPQPDGKSCGENVHCQSQNCFKGGGETGVCCNESCTTPCFSCFGFHTLDAPGLCRPIANGKDPFSQCESESTCGLTGWCGGGKCAIAPASTVCNGGSSCSVTATGASVTGLLCDGSGLCGTSPTTTACDPYAICAGNACATACATSAHCIAGYFCSSDQVCTPQDDIGSACSSAQECLSGNCVDGFCCDSECSGTCEACDEPGSIGTCVPVSGAPHGARACPPVAGQPCQAQACTGNAAETASCAGFVGADVICSPRSCSNGVISEETGCDGQGQCPAPATVNCGGTVCEGVGCKPSCASSDDCIAGWTCDVETEKCVFTPTCVDETAAKRIDGSDEDCGHYKCRGGACLTNCSESADCQSGRLCDRALGECRLPAEQAVDPGEPGCACRSSAARPRWSAWFVAALALLAWRRRA